MLKIDSPDLHTTFTPTNEGETCLINEKQGGEKLKIHQKKRALNYKI
jgi:hypothetical protein